jgi:hypothetical protein
VSVSFRATMSKFRYALAGALIAFGCASETFDLLGENEPPARNDGGEGGEATEPTAGKGGSGGVTAGSAGRTTGGGAGLGGGAGGTAGTFPGGGQAGSSIPCTGDDCIPPCVDGPCVSCATGEEVCLELKWTTRCHPHWERCVECWTDDHCGLAGFHCNPLAGTCEPECSSIRPCEDPWRPVCAGGRCVECVSPLDCYDDDRPVCRGASCEPCRWDQECYANEYCDFGTCKDRPPQPMLDGGYPQPDAGGGAPNGHGDMAGAGG